MEYAYLFVRKVKSRLPKILRIALKNFSRKEGFFKINVEYRKEYHISFSDNSGKRGFGLFYLPATHGFLCLIFLTPNHLLCKLLE